MSATDVVMVDEDGNQTCYVGPRLIEGLPQRVLEGFARRRLVALGEGCPCGARLVIPNRASRRDARRDGAGAVMSVAIKHEDDCAAIDPELERIAAGWGQ